MNFKELAEKRYSCRSFSPQPVEQSKLDEIIASAIKAPTAVNKQPYKIFHLESEAAKEAIKASTPCIFGAETFLVVGGKKSEAWTREFDQRNFADVDASIVATHLMLAIYANGLASTWVGHFDAIKLRELCPEMKDYDLIAVFPIGYPAADGGPSTRHFDRKDKSEVVSVI
ncbi:MAG: nitroreductase family protein [Eubacteriales bacterium]|nr:nitroreductase family protein [Eubacteriales bacterium]